MSNTIKRSLFKPVLTIGSIEIVIPKMIDLIGMETAQVVMLQSKDINPNDRKALVDRKYEVLKLN